MIFLSSQKEGINGKNPLIESRIIFVEKLAKSSERWKEQWINDCIKKKRKRKRRGKNRGFLGGKTADTNRVNKRGSYTYGGKFSASNIVTLLRVITHVAELSADARRLFHGQWEQWGTISRRSLCFTSWCTWRVNPSPHHAAPTKIPPRETVCPNCDRRPPRSTNASS